MSIVNIQEGDDSFIPLPAKRKRWFSPDRIDDLLFWGAHLCIVAISLAIVWSRIESTGRVLRTLLVAQHEENLLVRKQLELAQSTSDLAVKQELRREEAFEVGRISLDEVLARAAGIQEGVNSALEEIKNINASMLTLVEQSKVAAEKAANAGVQAASAANAATNASTSTRRLIGTKVETTADKERVLAQQRALAVKQKQLQKTINRVKKHGPTLLDKFFH